MSFLFAFFSREKNPKTKRKKLKNVSPSLPRPARLGAHAKGSQLPTPQPVRAGPDIHQRGAGQQGRVPLHDRELASRDRVLELLPISPGLKGITLLARARRVRSGWSLAEV